MQLVKFMKQVSSDIMRLGELLLSALFSNDLCRLCGSYLDPWGLLRDGKSSPLAQWRSATKATKPDTAHCLCQSCGEQLANLEPIVSEFPLDEGRTLTVLSACPYNRTLKRLIHRLKYQTDTLVSRDIGTIMRHALATSEFLPAPGTATIVPVPLHWWRQYKRGYNQAALLATELARDLQLGVSARGLSRRKLTRPQNKLSKAKRAENVRAGFKGNRQALAGKTVLLVDDVCTSGATLIECAKEAYRCGAKTVWAITAARAVLAHNSVIRNGRQDSASSSLLS